MLNKTYETLQLSAESKDDLDVISACLQDAVVPIDGLTFDKKKAGFYFMANRFCWECHPERSDHEEHHHRIHTGVYFDGVKSVKSKGFDPEHATGIMNLLGIESTDKKHVALHFSGGAEIMLEVESLLCLLKDLDEQPYPSHLKPQHKV